jgi:hypothetical protein
MSVGLHTTSECAHAIVNSAAGGALATVPAVSGTRVGIYRMILTTPAATIVTIQDTTGAALSAPFAFGASGGSITLDTPINGDPWWVSPNGRGIQINSSAAVQVSSDVYYIQGP